MRLLSAKLRATVVPKLKKKQQRCAAEFCRLLKKKTTFKVFFLSRTIWATCTQTKVAGLFLLWLWGWTQRLHVCVDFSLLRKKVGGGRVHACVYVRMCVCVLVRGLVTSSSSSSSSSSQRGLQWRIQDVVLVAVAVGVAVIALRAGRRGRLLQTHQHVHLQRRKNKVHLRLWRPLAQHFRVASRKSCWKGSWHFKSWTFKVKWFRFPLRFHQSGPNE